MQRDSIPDMTTMTYSMTFVEMPRCLLCISKGRIMDIEEFISWGDAIISKARETKLHKILIDNRNFALAISPMEIITFAEHLNEDFEMLTGLRLAILSSPENPEMSRLTETAFTNRSATYRRFDTLEEAEAWLQS